MRKQLKILSLSLAGALLSASIAATALAADRFEVLQEGDRDGSVYTLQEALAEDGYLKVNPTGYFGSLTEDAVKAFQRANGLVIDGKAGPKTLSKLYGSSYSASSSYSGNLNSGSFSIGDSALQVGDIQRRLMELGYVELTEFDSNYGPVTADGVRRFQRANKLTVDGVAGPNTLRCLFSSGAKAYTLYPGDRGNDIAKLQKRLSELGYLAAEATGYYGSCTEAAVKAFQKAHGLTADGVAGPRTLDKLYSPSASGTAASSERKQETLPVNDSDRVSSVLRLAKSKLGCKYVWSAEGPDSFDCSGFVYYVLKNSGLKVSRWSASGFSENTNWSKIGSISDLRKGDLVFFHPTGKSRISHVGIYLGGGEFIHAGSSKGKVIISSLNGGYYESHFSFGRRPKY